MAEYYRLKVTAVALRPLLLCVFNGNSARPDEILQLPSRDPERTIKVHVYRSSTDNPSPVLLNFHGSGYIVPWHGTDDEYARHVVANTNYTVFDVKYRLAPEHPYPAALEDVEDATNWILARPSDFDLSRLSISGFSAGGVLALVASSQLFPKGTFRHVIAFYPPADLARDSRTKDAPNPSWMVLPAWMADFFTSAYVSNTGVDLNDPRVSPFYASAESFQKNTLVITCSNDNLCCETEELVCKMQTVWGDGVVHCRMQDCGHAWDKVYKRGTSQEKEKKHAYELVVEMLTR